MIITIPKGHLQDALNSLIDAFKKAQRLRNKFEAQTTKEQNDLQIPLLQAELEFCAVLAANPELITCLAQDEQNMRRLMPGQIASHLWGERHKLFKLITAQHCEVAPEVAE